jgi:hypothetical protein
MTRKAKAAARRRAFVAAIASCPLAAAAGVAIEDGTVFVGKGRKSGYLLSDVMDWKAMPRTERERILDANKARLRAAEAVRAEMKAEMVASNATMATVDLSKMLRYIEITAKYNERLAETALAHYDWVPLVGPPDELGYPRSPALLAFLLA